MSQCKNCKSELPMHRLGCPEAKGETALYAKIEQLQTKNKKLKETISTVKNTAKKMEKKCYFGAGMAVMKSRIISIIENCTKALKG